MSYGQLPTKAEFIRAFNREVPDGVYGIGNDSGGRDGDYSDEELWELVKEQTAQWEDGDEEAGDFASVVLSTLGFEWI